MSKTTQIGEKVVKHLFQRQRLLFHHKAQLFNLQIGKLSIKIPASPLITNRQGIFQNGIINMLCDVSPGLAACTLLKNQSHSAVTLQLKINFMMPVKGPYVIAHGKVMKQTKSLIFTEGQIFNDKGQLCSNVIQTIKRILPEQNPSMKVV